MSRERSSDYVRYEQLLEETKDSEGIRHRDIAVKLLTEELAVEDDRVLEFAKARADKVADRFDSSRKALANGQTSLLDDSYFVLGDNERVPVSEASSVHTRQYKAILDRNHAVVAASWSVTTLHLDRLIRVQDEQGCSALEAEHILAAVADELN